MQTTHSTRRTTTNRQITPRSAHRRTQAPRRRRLTAIEAIILIVCLAAVLAVLIYSPHDAEGTHISTSLVRVRPAQTLWDLATVYPVDGMTTVETIDFIKQVNGLSTSQIDVGQELAVPVEAAVSAAVASR